MPKEGKLQFSAGREFQTFMAATLKAQFPSNRDRVRAGEETRMR